MHIENFKGIVLFDISFGDVTNIVGRNGAGKTSLHDAYLWTLTGEDSNECTNFKVQPLEADGKTKKKVDTKVKLNIEINGEPHEFCRVLAQQWSTPRGTSEEVQGSNTSQYFVDGMPKKYNEYRDFIKVLFCDIDNFKLMSSLTAFCNLETKTRRRKLLEMAGEMPELINVRDYPNLYPLYSATKDLEGIKSKIAYERKQFESEQASIPDKMTENERNLPQGIDFASLKEQRKKTEAEIVKIDATLQKSASSRQGVLAEIDAKKKEIFDLEVELSEIDGQLNRQIFLKKDDLSKKYVEKNGAIALVEQRINLATSRSNEAQRRKNVASEKRNKLAEQYKAKDSEKFDSSVNDTCPTCGRKFTEEELVSMNNELVRAFNNGKKSVLEQIAKQGMEAREEMEMADAEIKVINDEIEQLENEKAKLKSELAKIGTDKDVVPTLEFLRSQSKEYQNLLSKIEEKRSSLTISVPDIPEEEEKMKARKTELANSLKEIDMQLGQEIMIKKVAERREELKKEDVELTEKIAQCTAVLAEVKEYEKASMLVVEERVSSLFKFVKWKMYEKNLTNDGEKEICECIVEGVPYSTNLNTANVVNAGIDIVNAVSKWLDISVPVWVDGKESVTNLIYTDSQLITLSVKEGSELKVA